MIAFQTGHLACRLEPRSDNPDILTEYEHDFAGYCRDVLFVQPWEIQVAIADSVDRNPRTAVASCHASGKSFNAACIANWWIDTRSPSVVLTTAPTGRQVRQVLWREIAKLRKRGRYQGKRLPGRLMQVQVRIAEDRFALGFSSDNPDAVQGLREAKNVLIIEDESPGIAENVVEALETILTDPSSRHLKQGNPTVVHGHFYEPFHAQRERWTCFNISAFDTPNVQAGEMQIPGLVTRDWVDDRRRKWGESSPLWQTRVMGTFASSHGQKVVPVEWVHAAHDRWTDGPATGGTMGVDIASTGQDRTVATVLADNRLFEVDAFQIADLMEISKRIVELVIEYKPERLHVDATGLGLGVFHRLQEMAGEPSSPLYPVEIVGVVLGRRASDSNAWPRLMDELQWNMRQAFDPSGDTKIMLRPGDNELAEQLSLRSWNLDERHRIKVESKNELRRRGAHSPDSADSAMLCFYQSQPISVDFF